MQGNGRKDPAKIESAEQRQARLAAELRANLLKRKALTRSRADESDLQLPEKMKDGGTRQ